MLLIVYATVAGFIIDIVPWVYSLVPSVDGFVDYAGYLGSFALNNAVAGVVVLLLFLLLSGRSDFLAYPAVFGGLFLVGPLNSVLAVLGFANFAWHLIIAGFCTVSLIAVRYLDTLRTAIGDTLPVERDRLIDYKGELWSAVRIIVQVILGFVAIVGVGTSILFRDGFQGQNESVIGIQIGVGFVLVAGFVYVGLFQTIVDLVLALRSKRA